MLDFDNYVADIEEHKTVSTVFGRFTDAMARLGFDTVAFQTINGFKGCHTSLVSGRSLPSNLNGIDADHRVVKQALKEIGPFFDADGYLCIPLRGVGGSFAVIIATNDKSSMENPPTLLGFTNAIANVFYTRICDLCFEHGSTVRLTPKERNILCMVADGYTKATIAESLGVTSHAVDFHFRNIMKKHGTSRIVVAVAESIRTGVI